MREIKINSTTGYLNLEDLPANCIFNKKVTGCGGTTVALFSDKDYVIAVPTTELIINKTGLDKSGVAKLASPDGKEQTVFGLWGSFDYQTKKSLKEYCSSFGVKKIMCTYDKIEQLVKLIDPSKYQLLVDEYHVLLKAYSYRKTAIDGVLFNFKSFKSYCFLSATPISPDFTPSLLKEIELVEATWNDVDFLQVQPLQTNNPYTKACNIINDFMREGYITINGMQSKELFFFLNSVTDIAEILDKCNLQRDQVKIVCADTEDNRLKLVGYTISNSRAVNKPITFITSKSFEGADYYSETGVCFVISNTLKTQTQLDISTDIFQIAGRIRTATNPFRNILFHIFNTSGKRKIDLETSYEEMVAKTNEEVESIQEFIDFANNNTKAKKSADRILANYVYKDSTGKYFLNDLEVKLELYNFKIDQYIYKNGINLRKEYNRNGVITGEDDYEKVEKFKFKSSTKMNFKDAYLKYSELIKRPFITNETPIIKEIVKVQPLVLDAFSKLGDDKVRSLRYVKRAIENEIINQSDSSNDMKIAVMANKHFGLGFISSKKAKEIIKSIYSSTGVTNTAKGADLSKWFDCKEVSKKIEGKTVKGYEIIARKFKVAQK